MYIHQESPNVIIVSDDGEELPWSVGVFEKTRFNGVENPFREVNGYWHWLPEKTRRAIWALYKEIWEIFRDAGQTYVRGCDNPTGTMGSIRETIETVSHLVAKLYELMPMHEIDHWLKMHGQIKYPDNLRSSLEPEDTSPDKTYLKADYHGLVILTTAVRPMVPIWGEFVKQIKNETSTTYKEYIAIQLLSRSYVMTCEPMERLMRYISSSVTREVDSSAAIINGLSTSELPDWLLSLVVVRRMALGEVDAIEEKGSIISNIYGFVTHILKELDKKFGGVKEKYPEGDDSEGEEGSRLEFFKVKQALTTGDVSTFNAFTEDIYAVAHNIDPTIPESLVARCLETLPRIEHMDPHPVHEHLAQWVMMAVMTPGAIPCISKQPLIRAMCVTQAALWHWGFHDLAVLATAHPERPDVHSMVAGQSRTKIPPALLERLNEFYPHQFQDAASRKSNVAQVEINDLTSEIHTMYWVSNISHDLIAQSSVRLNNARQLEIPPTLAEQLTRLVIHINQ